MQSKACARGRRCDSATAWFFCCCFLLRYHSVHLPRRWLCHQQVVSEQSQSGLLVEGLREMALMGHLLHINGFCFSPESVMRWYAWLLSVSGSFVLSSFFSSSFFLIGFLSVPFWCDDINKCCRVEDFTRHVAFVVVVLLLSFFLSFFLYLLPRPDITVLLDWA